MSVDTGDGRSKMTYEEVLSFVREFDGPCVTAGDVAEEFEVTNEAAVYRLDKLEERGDLRGRVVGASAKIWYPVG